MSDVMQLLHEFRPDLPVGDAETIARIHASATRGRPRLLIGRRLLARRRVVVIAVAAAAITSVAFSFSIGTYKGSAPGSSVASRIPGNGTRLPGAAPISVSSAAEADALLPFAAVLPSNATLGQMQVGDPKHTPASV